MHSVLTRWHYALGCVLVALGCEGSSTNATALPLGSKAIATLAGVPGAPIPPPRTSDRQIGRPLGASSEPIEGYATFIVVPGGVDLTIKIRNCNAPVAGYVVELHEGDVCAGKNLEGPIWRGARGIELPPLHCSNTGGLGQIFYTHLDSDVRAWAVAAAGDGSASANVVGHSIVIRDPEYQGAPISCGNIALDTLALAEADRDARVIDDAPVEIKASLAGSCVWQQTAGDNSNCPEPKKLVSCLDTHCELSACLRVCADTIACLETDADADPCVSACPRSDACSECTSNLSQCTLGYCRDTVACSPPPTPGGPCSKLEACCKTQGDFAAQCLEQIKLLELLGGDKTCYGTELDWDFNTHIPVPCTYE